MDVISKFQEAISVKTNSKTGFGGAAQLTGSDRAGLGDLSALGNKRLTQNVYTQYTYNYINSLMII